MRQSIDDIRAEVFRVVELESITEGKGSAAPAPAPRTAGELANRMQDAVTRIGKPTRRLAASRDYDARPGIWISRSDRHRRSQVHSTCDRTHDPAGAVDQPDELPKLGLAPQIQDTPQRRVIVAVLANLSKQESAAKMIDDGLPPAEMPPLNSEIEFATRHDNPKRQILAQNLLHERRRCFFFFGKMDITF